ncbi:retrotransposon protein, putative, ty1-copia subclass [Tanacetum coccineum]
MTYVVSDSEEEEPKDDDDATEDSDFNDDEMGWIDYKETFSPVADIRAIRILIAIAAYYDYEIWQMDVKLTFTHWNLNGYLNGRGEFQSGKYPMQDKLRLSKSQGASTPAELKRMQNVSYASVVGSIISGFLATCAGISEDTDDLKSQTGYVFVLNGSAVDWNSVKQSIIATSSAEAEYTAAFDASKEAVWVGKFISGLGVCFPQLKNHNMYCDNTGATL